MAKKKKEEDEVIVDVEEVYSKSEQFIEENQKTITIVVGAIVLIIAGYVGWNRFYIAPKQKEAASQMFKAEQYFKKDSFRLALEGYGQYPGFLEIIDNYGMTKAANLSHYYAGISYLNLGEYEKAIDHLKKFDGDDDMVGPLSIAATGDAYVELGEHETAIGYFLDAADEADNEFLTPVFLMKAGQTYEATGEYGEALEIYERIQKKYPESQEASQIEKYIARAETAMAGK